MALVSWQGWQIILPDRWSPVRLDGDYDSGTALFADLHRPRLGLRWQKKPGRRFDAEKWTLRAMREEIGKLAAEESRPVDDGKGKWLQPRLYLESTPPGRDVWLAQSSISGRTVELVYHTRREHPLADTIVPTLSDLPVGAPMAWSIFELSCIVPAGMKLEKQQLNAGDLSLTFADKQRDLTIRQVAVASLALKRLPLEKWLAQQMRLRQKHYRPAGVATDVSIAVRDQLAEGTGRHSRRRRRFVWMRWIAPQYITYALHDLQRDRLLLLDSSDEAMLKEAARSIGWAREK